MYRANTLPQALFHLMTDRAITFTLQSGSGLPILAKYKDFKHELCIKLVPAPSVLGK